MSKIKASEKINKFLDLTKKLKNLQNMKIIIVGTLKMIPKGLEKNGVIGDRRKHSDHCTDEFSYNSY